MTGLRRIGLRRFGMRCGRWGRVMRSLKAALGRRIAAAGDDMAEHARRLDHEECSDEEFNFMVLLAGMLWTIGARLTAPKRSGLPRETDDVSQEVVSLSVVGEPCDAADAVWRLVNGQS